MTPEPEALQAIAKMSRVEAQDELRNILQHIHSLVPESVMEASGADTFNPAGVRALHMRVMRLLGDATWPEWKPLTDAHANIGPVLLYEPPENLRHDGLVFTGSLDRGVAYNDGDQRMWPTHWMPLPAFPVESAKSVPHASVSVDQHPTDPQDSK